MRWVRAGGTVTPPPPAPPVHRAPLQRHCCSPCQNPSRKNRTRYPRRPRPFCNAAYGSTAASSSGRSASTASAERNLRQHDHITLRMHGDGRLQCIVRCAERLPRIGCGCGAAPAVPDPALLDVARLAPAATNKTATWPLSFCVEHCAKACSANAVHN